MQNQKTLIVPTLMLQHPCKKINSHSFELSHANRLLPPGIPKLLCRISSWCKARVSLVLCSFANLCNLQTRFGGVTVFLKKRFFEAYFNLLLWHLSEHGKKASKTFKKEVFGLFEHCRVYPYISNSRAATTLSTHLTGI